MGRISGGAPVNPWISKTPTGPPGRIKGDGSILGWRVINLFFIACSTTLQLYIFLPGFLIKHPGRKILTKTEPIFKK
jgi:hypothetical protein